MQDSLVVAVVPVSESPPPYWRYQYRTVRGLLKVGNVTQFSFRDFRGVGDQSCRNPWRKFER